MYLVTKYAAAVNSSCTVIVRRDRSPDLSARQDVCWYIKQSGDEHGFLKRERVAARYNLYILVCPRGKVRRPSPTQSKLLFDVKYLLKVICDGVRRRKTPLP